MIFMVKCNKCNAEISNTDAKFCDNCGEYLNLMSKSFNRFKMVL